MSRKIVQVENVELGEWELLQMTLYTDGNVQIHIMTDDDPQKNVTIDVPKRLFFGAALRLLEEDNH